MSLENRTDPVGLNWNLVTFHAFNGTSKILHYESSAISEILPPFCRGIFCPVIYHPVENA